MLKNKLVLQVDNLCNEHGLFVMTIYISTSREKSDVLLGNCSKLQTMSELQFIITGEEDHIFVCIPAELMAFISLFLFIESTKPVAAVHVEFNSIRLRFIFHTIMKTF